MDKYIQIIQYPKYNDTIRYNNNIHIPKFKRNLKSFHIKRYNKYNIPIPKKLQSKIIYIPKRFQE